MADLAGEVSGYCGVAAGEVSGCTVRGLFLCGPES